LNAMVLAAGRGTRLGALGRQTPKVLVDVGGAPLLARHLAWLERAGVRRAVVNAYHLAEQVRDFLDAYSGPLETVCVVEEELLGTAGGVRNALGVLGPDPFVVVYGDILVDEPLSPILAFHDVGRAELTIAVHEAESVAGKGVVEIGVDDNVARFLEKPTAEVARPAWINSGVYVIDPAVIAGLPVGVPLDFGHDVLPTAIERGHRVLAYRLSAPVLDLGTPEALAEGRRQVGR
jgi:NDP-sugar pyrophosphorylase family protein